MSILAGAARAVVRQYKNPTWVRPLARPIAALPPRRFSFPVANMSSVPSVTSAQPLLEAVQNRRTYYALNKDLPAKLTDKRIHEIVDHVVTHTPSSFNAQSARLVVLTGDAHDKFWKIVLKGLEAIVKTNFEATASKIAGFAAGAGTILFYEDPEPVKKLQEAFPSYASNFPIWSEHTSAMHQILLWTSLEAEGAGANLQHYNPIPDEATFELWKDQGIKKDWKLRAQLVFGGRASEDVADKQFQPLSERVIYIDN